MYKRQKTMYKSGDVILCKGTSALSKTILKATSGEWSHTAQFIYLYGDLYVIDAQKEGIVPRNFEKWKREYKYEFEVYRNPEINDEITYVKNALCYCGVDYDFKHLGLGLIKSLFKKKDFNDKYRNNGKFICSEYTAKLIGIENPEDYSPQKIADFVKLHKWEKI